MQAEEVQINKTAVVRDTNNPEYNATFKMSINRSKKFQRFVQRHGVKLEVWSKGYVLNFIYSSCTIPFSISFFSFRMEAAPLARNISLAFVSVSLRKLMFCSGTEPLLSAALFFSRYIILIIEVCAHLVEG